MSLAVLQLLTSHFNSIEVRASLDELPEDLESINPGIDVAHTIAQREDSQEHWRVSLKVSVYSGENGFYPYSAEFDITGFFEFEEEFCSDKTVQDLARIISVNGAGMLFASVRELFTLLTSRGPFGPTPPLPSIDFRVIKPDPPEYVRKTFPQSGVSED